MPITEASKWMAVFHSLPSAASKFQRSKVSHWVGWLTLPETQQSMSKGSSKVSRTAVQISRKQHVVSFSEGRSTSHLHTWPFLAYLDLSKVSHQTDGQSSQDGCFRLFCLWLGSSKIVLHPKMHYFRQPPPSVEFFSLCAVFSPEVKAHKRPIYLTRSKNRTCSLGE